MLTGKEFKARRNQCLICGSQAKTFLASGVDYEYASTDMKFDFYQCQRCSLIFIDPLPEPPMLEVIYPKNYYAYCTHNYSRFIKDMRARQLDGKVHKFLTKSNKDNVNGIQILEIGCGRGDLLLAFRRANTTTLITGIDFSEESIAYIKKLGFHGQAGNITEMNFNGQKFDLVVCQQLLEHLHNPLVFLQKVKSWLAKDGVFILETPGVESIDRMIFKGCWGGYHIPRHFFLFSEKTLKMILDKCGFEVIDIFYDMCLAFWVWSLHNVIFKYTKIKFFASFFSLRNPVVLLPFWFIEHLRMPFMKTASMGVVCKSR